MIKWLFQNITYQQIKQWYFFKKGKYMENTSETAS